MKDFDKENMQEAMIKGLGKFLDDPENAENLS